MKNKNTRITNAMLASAALLAAATLFNPVTASAQDTSSSNQSAPAAPAATAATAPAPTPSKISAVTVYTDRAIVTRTARADLPAGDSSIVLEKFPAALLDASVQVRGRGTASATNILWWRIDLKPGEKREVPYKFNIEYPGDIQVSGLE